MEIEGKKRIYKCYDILIENIADFSLVDHLNAELLLTMDEGREILSKSSDRNKAREMLDILLNKTSFPKGSNSYLIFVRSLRNTKRDDLANELQNADISTVTDQDIAKKFSNEEKTDKMMQQINEMTQQLQLLQSILNIRPIQSGDQSKAPIQTGDQLQQRNTNTIDKIVLNSPSGKQIIITSLDVVNFFKRLQELPNINFGNTGKDGKPILEEIDIIKRKPVGSLPIDPSNQDDLDRGNGPALRNIKLTYLNSIEATACEIGQDLLCNESLEPPHSDRLFAYIRLQVQKVIRRNERALNYCIERLHITELQAGYPAVGKIADELFIDKNWGRIITWYAFWKHMAVKLPGGDGSVDYDENTRFILGNFIGCVLYDRCGRWIEHHGGWSALTERSERYCSLS